VQKYQQRIESLTGAGEDTRGTVKIIGGGGVEIKTIRGGQVKKN